ncbi:hypothetical protein BVRB_5g116920 isoform B [Beta vulgaris subsp. vulgaris]|nr:hypothetical protein BVRB_5g116920 isoform B [Beta vulgaris subsp. vulgaris]
MEAECNVQTSDDRLVNEGVSEVKNAAGEISSILEQIRLEEDALNHKERDEKTDSHPERGCINRCPL